jgi:thioredoxin 1
MFKFTKFFVLGFLFTSLSACAQSNNNNNFDVKTFETKLNATKDAVVLDVRSTDEFNGGHLAKALNLNYNDPNFAANIAKLDKNKPYFVYCAAGVRSAKAATAMRSSGFTKVFEMKGGINAWQAANLKTEK